MRAAAGVDGVGGGEMRAALLPGEREREREREISERERDD
jgi:hypothetical protein